MSLPQRSEVGFVLDVYTVALSKLTNVCCRSYLEESILALVGFLPALLKVGGSNPHGLQQFVRVGSERKLFPKLAVTADLFTPLTNSNVFLKPCLLTAYELSRLVCLAIHPLGGRPLLHLSCDIVLLIPIC